MKRHASTGWPANPARARQRPITTVTP
jgi:hypothetical protein